MSEQQDDRLRLLTSSYSAPDSLRTALTHHTVPEELRPGQLWRATWEDTSLLVLIVSHFHDGAGQAVVATIGEEPPTDSQVPVVTFKADTARSVTAWISLQQVLHQRVLEVLIEDSRTSRSAATELWANQVKRLIDVFDPGALLEAELRDELNVLALAPGLRVASEHPRALKDLLPGDGGSRLQAVRDLLGVTQNDAMELLRGRNGLTEQQARILEQGLALPHGVLPTAGGLPNDVVMELEHPRWRPQLRALAFKKDLAEREVKEQIGAKAYALAARESSSTPDWRQRIELILRGVV